MRLIDADALIADLYDEQKHSHLMAPFKLCTADRVDLKFLLNEAPTIDAAPVVHGKWRYCGSDRFNDAFECSVCGRIAMNDSDFCPNCGAKMDGGNNAEE